MVEVDPMLLITVGSIAAGLAAAALCLRAPAKTIEKKVVSNKKTEQVASIKPKKKATKTAKKVVSVAANDSAAESDASEIAALVAEIGPVDLQQKPTKKAKEAAKASGPTAADVAATKAAAKKAAEAAEAVLKAQQNAEAAAEAARIVAMTLAAEEEAKKSKKAKETPEQRAARLDRQKLAKVKKVEEEELSKNVAIQLAAVESKSVAKVVSSVTAAQPLQIDGWAVVEDKRKVKAKALPPVVVPESSGPSEPSLPADYVKTEVTVESKKIGIIIGPKGVTLHGIQDATGVEINTPKGERDATSPIVITVAGPAEGVAKAVKAINELVTKGYTKLLAGEDFKEGSLEVYPTYLSEIIGKGGANIRAIQDATGVKLSIPQVTRDHNQPVKITVAGNKEKVQQAKDLIIELTKYYHTSVTHPGQIHVEMDVPSALYNYIIGARGSEIKHIQANFKVSVHIPNVDTISKNVLIVGDPHGVKGAEKYIQKIIDQAVADKEAAEKMNDAWVDGEPEDAAHEQWMDAYAHPSRKNNLNDSTLSSSLPIGVGNSSSNVNDDSEGGLKSSSSSAAASASAWGASVLASSDGW